MAALRVVCLTTWIRPLMLLMLLVQWKLKLIHGLNLKSSVLLLWIENSCHTLRYGLIDWFSFASLLYLSQEYPVSKFAIRWLSLAIFHFSPNDVNFYHIFPIVSHCISLICVSELACAFLAVYLYIAKSACVIPNPCMCDMLFGGRNINNLYDRCGNGFLLHSISCHLIQDLHCFTIV